MDCWFGGLIALGIGPECTTSNGPAFKPPLLQLLPRIKFWNHRHARHGIASVANKITALNGQDVCSIYGCGTDFLLELVGGIDAGSSFGLFVSNTTQLGVGGGLTTRVATLPKNTTILTFLKAGVPFANISVGTQGSTLAFFLCSNATVFMGGSFWSLANENVEEVVESRSGAVISKKNLFPGPSSGQMQHFFSLSAGETVTYTKIQEVLAMKTDDADVSVAMKTDGGVARRADKAPKRYMVLGTWGHGAGAATPEFVDAGVTAGFNAVRVTANWGYMEQKPGVIDWRVLDNQTAYIHDVAKLPLAFNIWCQVRALDTICPPYNRHINAD